MTTLFWVLIAILFIVSFIGVVVPIIPAAFLIWGGFLLYHFGIDSSQLTLLFWLITVGITVLLFVADLFTNNYFVVKYGGGRKSKWGAMIGVVIGIFIYPPFGIVLTPFVLVFLIELYDRRSYRVALKAAFGALVGFVSGVAFKVVIQATMILLFFIFIVI